LLVQRRFLERRDLRRTNRLSHQTSDEIVDRLGGRLGSARLDQASNLKREGVNYEYATHATIPAPVTEHAKRHSLTGIPERPDTSGISAICDHQLGSQKCFTKIIIVKRVAQMLSLHAALGHSAWVNSAWSIDRLYHPAADADLEGKHLRSYSSQHGRPLSQRLGHTLCFRVSVLI
jgi:hypothetical protein